jgi:integrase
MKRHTRLPPDPSVIPYGQWPPVNRGFYAGFRKWLKATGYSSSALNIYGIGARLALGYLGKHYWKIDPDTDLERVKEYIRNRYTSESTSSGYNKGVAKLGDYIRLRCNRPPREKPINWDYYLGTFPDWLADDVRNFINRRRRSMPPKKRNDQIASDLSHLTLSLRWMVSNHKLEEIGDLTPALWFEYLDTRLSAGSSPKTVNGELRLLQSWLHVLKDQGRPICQRMLRLRTLRIGPHIPRDVPAEQLRVLLEAIREDMRSSHKYNHRLGLMDMAWFLLMVHSGLRTGEVRRLKMGDVDWDRRFVRIEQSKGLKDRLVPLSPAAIAALRDYLTVRGPADALPENVFIFRHAALTRSYCYQRLRTYGGRCGVRVTPHQLRHSCASLLLNSGAPVLMVKAILGHKFVDTTLRYARLYDGTVAADYYRAMAVVEKRMALEEDGQASPPSYGELIALVDSLSTGTLNEAQYETVRVLRAGLQALAEQMAE